MHTIKTTLQKLRTASSTMANVCPTRSRELLVLNMLNIKICDFNENGSVCQKWALIEFLRTNDIDIVPIS